MKIQRGGIFFIQQYFYNLKITDETLIFCIYGKWIGRWVFNFCIPQSANILYSMREKGDWNGKG